jgi:hypothetical protein
MLLHGMSPLLVETGAEAMRVAEGRVAAHARRPLPARLGTHSGGVKRLVRAAGGER